MQELGLDQAEKNSGGQTWQFSQLAAVVHPHTAGRLPCAGTILPPQESVRLFCTSEWNGGVKVASFLGKSRERVASNSGTSWDYFSLSGPALQ